MGWSSTVLNELSERFVADCTPSSVVLDIGAAMGVATIPALAAGATVHAIDPSAEHLETLRNLTPPEHRQRLMVHTGRFPRDLKLPPGALHLAHASNVFHFLTGRQLELGAALLQRLLVPGGRVYILAATPYMAPFASAIPTFETNLRNQVDWPGWIPNTRLISSHRLLDQLPKSIHLLDESVLTRVLTSAGFAIEECRLFRRRDLPKSIQFDGRENVAVIARRI